MQIFRDQTSAGHAGGGILPGAHGWVTASFSQEDSLLREALCIKAGLSYSEPGRVRHLDRLKG